MPASREYKGKSDENAVSIAIPTFDGRLYMQAFQSGGLLILVRSDQVSRASILPTAPGRHC